MGIFDIRGLWGCNCWGVGLEKAIFTKLLEICVTEKCQRISQTSLKGKQLAGSTNDHYIKSVLFSLSVGSTGVGFGLRPKYAKHKRC